MEEAWVAKTDQALAFWPYVATLLNVVVSLVATGHAVLSKRDTRAAIGWVGVIWLAPILGVLLYVWLGINRIERRARSLRTGRRHPQAFAGLPAVEVLVSTPSGRRLIAENRDVELNEVTRGGDAGMLRITQSLYRLFQQRLIDHETGRQAAPSIEEFEMSLRGIRQSQRGVLD